MKTKWKTIGVPEPVFELLHRLSEREKEAYWKVILRSCSFYERLLKSTRRKSKLSDVEKVSWYITKLSVGWGFFLSNPCEETWKALQERFKEIQERLGVDITTEIELITSLAEDYMSTDNEELRKKKRIEMNQVFKSIIKSILLEKFFELESRPEATETKL